MWKGFEDITAKGIYKDFAYLKLYDQLIKFNLVGTFMENRIKDINIKYILVRKDSLFKTSDVSSILNKLFWHQKRKMSSNPY